MMVSLQMKKKKTFELIPLQFVKVISINNAQNVRNPQMLYKSDS